MLYIVGGVPRVGKSTVSRRLSDWTGAIPLSLDCFRDIVATFGSDTVRNDLLVDVSSSRSYDDWLAAVRRRDRRTWEIGIQASLYMAQKCSDVVVEGCVWPDDLVSLEPTIQYRAVFLVDSSALHADRIEASVNDVTSADNWLRADAWTVATRRELSAYNVKRSQALAGEANSAGLQHVDVAETESMSLAAEAAIAVLLAGGRTHSDS